MTKTMEQMMNYCDRCNAPAQLAIAIGELDLIFCGHHAREHETKLKEIATKIVGDFDFVM